MRVPFPFKVFLSYLLVLACGAVPTWIYLQAHLETRLREDAARQLAERLRPLANALAPLDRAQREAKLRSLAPLLPERLTYVDGSGAVLYDSEVTQVAELENHVSRSEIQQALGGAAGPLSDLGYGVDSRTSATTGAPSLYVAVRLEAPSGKGSHVLRLATPTARLDEVSASLSSFFRNSQAGAISVALLLSLISAVVFVLPLRRLRKQARALASGDYTARGKSLGNDEIGDVARALQELAFELRRRLAAAEAGSAILAQLLEELDTPAIVFQGDGALVAVNAGGRDLVRHHAHHGDALEDTVASLATLPALREAWDQARERCEVTPATLALPSGKTLECWVSALERPGQDGYGVLWGARPCQPVLQRTAQVHAVGLDDLVGQALHELEHEPLPELSAERVATVDDNEAVATRLFLRAVIHAKRKLELQLKEQPTQLGLEVERKVDGETRATIGRLLRPAGGRIEANGKTTTLWLARA